MSNAAPFLACEACSANPSQAKPSPSPGYLQLARVAFTTPQAARVVLAAAAAHPLLQPVEDRKAGEAVDLLYHGPRVGVEVLVRVRVRVRVRFRFRFRVRVRARARVRVRVRVRVRLRVRVSVGVEVL